MGRGKKATLSFYVLYHNHRKEGVVSVFKIVVGIIVTIIVLAIGLYLTYKSNLRQ